MHGIPFGLKDIYDAAGVRTTGYSRVFLDNVPKENATTTEKLLRQGAVLLGKTATHELANGGPSFDLPFPPARNPWNPAHFTGGSSTGAAAGVAAGFLPAALGSDTGGSVRIPAAYCGVVGLKPTYGLVSRAGVMPNSFSFDHCGPLTWTVEDCAIVLQAIAGFDAKDAASVDVALPDYRASLRDDIRGMRVGVVRHFWEDEAAVTDEVKAAMTSAIDVLKHLGARIEDVRLQPLRQYYDVKNVIAKSEAFAVHQKNLIERLDDFGVDFLGFTLPGCLFQAADYVQAQRERARMLGFMQSVYERHDVLLTACDGPAPKLGVYGPTRVIDQWRRANIYVPFSVTAGPALALCNGFSRSGLPLSMQITARPFNEAAVLRIGHAYERATQWRAQRPHLEPGISQVPIEVNADAGEAPHVDEAVLQHVADMAKRSGLRLPELQLRKLGLVAPYALDMVRRISRDHGFQDAPADVLRLD
jgi:aspartyl-tRNA(Asn)/glutamyl-tRNA(Gln) amidotransferase subunit A